MTNWRNKPRAHAAIAAAVRDGRVAVPPACEACNGENSDLDAHHHMGYAEEHWLTVKWLCRRCHKLEHGRVRRALDGEKHMIMLRAFMTEEQNRLFKVAAISKNVPMAELLGDLIRQYLESASS